MVTYNFNLQGLDRELLAEEVISSAAKVLIIAGFSEDDVATLFRQAAQQIETGEAKNDYAQDEADEEVEAFEVVDRYDVAAAFRNHLAIKSLNRLAKRAEIIEKIEDDVTLSRAMDVALEAVKLRLEALSWVVTEAERVGLEVASSRDAWVESATDDELDEEDKIVFLDDYSFSSDFNWYLISEIARYLVNSGSTVMLSSFSNLVLNDSLALDDHVREEVQRAATAAEKYDDFQTYVMSYAGEGEIAQSEFIDAFVRIYEFEGGTQLLQNWLDGMARNGELERVKRSNRWRVTVF